MAFDIGGMIGGAAGTALAGPAGALTGAAATGATRAVGEANREEFKSLIPAPRKMSQLPGWGVAMSLGQKLSQSFMKKNPDWAGKLKEDDLTQLMQALMNQVFKSMSSSLDYLKELDDDEEKFGGTAIYNQ